MKVLYLIFPSLVENYFFPRFSNPLWTISGQKMFEYDHSLLSLIELHKIGIRSTRELEEVIEGYSFANEEFLEKWEYNVIRFVGFTNRSRALKIACRFTDDWRLATIDARIASVQEIISHFCRYC